MCICTALGRANGWAHIGHSWRGFNLLEDVTMSRLPLLSFLAPWRCGCGCKGSRAPQAENRCMAAFRSQILRRSTGGFVFAFKLLMRRKRRSSREDGKFSACYPSSKILTWKHFVYTGKRGHDDFVLKIVALSANYIVHRSSTCPDGHQSQQYVSSCSAQSTEINSSNSKYCAMIISGLPPVASLYMYF